MSTSGSDQLDGELRRAFAWLSSVGNYMVVSRDGETHLFIGGRRTTARRDTGSQDDAAVSFLDATKQAMESHES